MTTLRCRVVDVCAGVSAAVAAPQDDLLSASAPALLLPLFRASAAGSALLWGNVAAERAASAAGRQADAYRGLVVAAVRADADDADGDADDAHEEAVAAAQFVEANGNILVAALPSLLRPQQPEGRSTAGACAGKSGCAGSVGRDLQKAVEVLLDELLAPQHAHRVRGVVAETAAARAVVASLERRGVWDPAKAPACAGCAGEALMERPLPVLAPRDAAEEEDGGYVTRLLQPADAPRHAVLMRLYDTETCAGNDLPDDVEAATRASEARIRNPHRPWMGTFLRGGGRDGEEDLLVSQAVLNGAVRGGICVLGGVYTDRAHRRRGLSERTLRALFAHAEGVLGCTTASLFTNPDTMSAAYALYKHRLGFQDVGDGFEMHFREPEEGAAASPSSTK